MSDAIVCEATLLARTVPEETRDGDITVCSAWWQPALGGLIRIYPLDIRTELRAWNRYELRLVKSRKDSRWRSYKLDEEQPRLVAKGNREQMRDTLFAAAGGVTIKKLNEQRDSMGVILPTAVAGKMKVGQPDVTHRFGNKTFGVRPRLHFDDADGAHSLGLNEWGCYEMLRKGGDPDRLWDYLKLGREDREELLLVGNLRDHRNAWIVIAVVGYQSQRPELFARVPGEQAARVFARDGYQCVSCGNQDTLTIDHVVPRNRGGGNDDSNLRTLCLKCNSGKNDRLDHEWQESLL